MRRREHRTEIHAPITSVWKALVDAEEIVRWFAVAAEVDPREGGRYWVSWGEGMAGESRIEALETERRLAVAHAWEGVADLDPPIVQEYLLESRGDVTVLRVVQTGIPDSSEWDDFYEDTGRGWKMFLAGLKHYLEKHRGSPRKSIMFMQPVTVPVADAWDKLVGPGGIAADGLSDIAVGTRASFESPFGQKLDVGVLVHEPPYTLAMAIDNLEDSLLALDFERMGDETFLYANLSTFGLEASRVEELRSQWKRWIERLFPVPSGSTA